ncbi:MAG: SIS domain-containing protein [Ginsengibacter sp.]
MNKFLDEIFEQPAAIDNVLNFYSGAEGKKKLAEVKAVIDDNKIEQVIFTGMGSSYFISHAASILFNQLKFESLVVNASELLHYNFPILKKHTLLICISQSGESFEIKELLKHLPEGIHCVGIVNEEKSTLACGAEIALPCKGGKEEMTSTKTYVVTSLVAFILAWYLAGEWNDNKITMIKRLRDNFKKWVESYQSKLLGARDFMGEMQTLQIIARGPSFSAASQSALMFKEAVQIPATGILGGEFRHGPMEMVGDGFKAILFAAKGKTFIQSIKMTEDIVEFGGKVLLITNEKVNLPDDNIKQIFIDEPDEFMFSINAVLPVQLFIDDYAKVRGFVAGSFSRGAKVTIIE